MDWLNRDLYLIFTPSLCRSDPWTTLTECLGAGVQLVQWRAPLVDSEDLKRCAEACGQHQVPLIVNNDVTAAALCAGAAGSHIGQDDMAPDHARQTLRPDQILGISSHNLIQAQQAVADGADCIGIGPCYASTTKGYQTGLSAATLRSVFERIEIPSYAIGGITAERVAELRSLGCQRVAVSQSILGAIQPGREVERILTALHS